MKSDRLKKLSKHDWQDEIDKTVYFANNERETSNKGDLSQPENEISISQKYGNAVNRIRKSDRPVENFESKADANSKTSISITQKQAKDDSRRAIERAKEEIAREILG
jgi:hypothetical protein